MNPNEIKAKLEIAGHDWAQKMERDAIVQARRRRESLRRERSVESLLLVALGVISWAVIWMVWVVVSSL